MSEKLKEAKELLKQLRCYENHGGNFALWKDIKLLADCVWLIIESNDALSLLSEPTGYYDVADLYDEAEPPKCKNPDCVDGKIPDDYTDTFQKLNWKPCPDCQPDAGELPSWWPTNPYPESIFPMARHKYAEIVPDLKTRTALSGMLGREFWDIASKAIWEAVQDFLTAAEAKNAQQAKRIEELEHRIDELTAIRISLETQCDQRAKRIEELEGEKGKREQKKRPMSLKCLTPNCDGLINASYCDRCLRQWES